MEADVRKRPYDWQELAIGHPLIDSDWRTQPKYSDDEFWEMAYTDLGKRYGLNDIREAEQ